MKKLLIAIVAVGVATGAMAGLVTWGTGGAALIDNELGGLLAMGEAVQLVKVVGAVDTGADIALDLALWDDEVVELSAIGAGKPPPAPSWDGALSVSASYVTAIGEQYYIRAWSGVAMAEGAFYGVSEVFDIADAADNVEKIMTTAGFQTSVEVIPEPATLGLMGVAGLGMFLARRKARR